MKYTNIETTEEEYLGELKIADLTIDKTGPTVEDRVKEINSNFAQSLANIDIDTEGKDLLEVIAEMADKIYLLQRDLYTVTERYL